MTQVTLAHLAMQYPRGNFSIEDLSLEIGSGQLTALLGPSGCGKTTILKMIAGLITPGMGDILFDGISVLNLAPEQRGAVMVFQNHLLFPHMSVGDNIAFGLKMRGENPKVIKRQVAEMLELVQLEGYESRKPSQLSGGQQQRVALARALIVKPRVLLLDEPLSNLDAYLRDEMRDLIRNLQRQKGITTVFVTHDQEEAVLLADQLALILNGRLQQMAEPRSFYEEPVNLSVAQFFGAKNRFSGYIQDSVVYTNLGRFQVVKNHLTPGPVEIVIRPENIRIHTDQHSTENTMTGEVQSCMFTGTHVRIKVRVQDTLFEVLTETRTGVSYQARDKLQLYFPPEKLLVYSSGQ